MSRNTLFTNQELRKGDYLISNNGNHKAIFQEDGNFVVYTWKPVWASDTYGKPGTNIVMQGDGNLVLYNSNGDPLWASNSYQKSNTTDNRLSINNDGGLVVQRGSTVLWSATK